METTLREFTGHRYHDGKTRVPDGQIDVRDIIGSRSFARLPARVRARFTHHAADHPPIVYRGIMQRVEGNKLGYFMALASRLAGRPVVAGTGHNVPCTVTLKPDHTLGGTIWHRHYAFEAGVETAATTKRISHDGGPIESFSGLFGMTLDICELDGELHFITERYFAEWRGWRIKLPRFLTPGRLTVVHADQDDGWFRFTMTLKHPWFGVVLHQDGLFYDPED